MPRYINEDEFVAWVKEHWCADCQNDNGLRCRACWIDDAIDIVEEAPEADVAPRSEVAREIFEEIEQLRLEFLTEKITGADLVVKLFLLKKKYTEGDDPK